MTTHTITIDMGAKCVECGKGGATPCRLCMKCATKAMDPKAAMKSPEGKAVQARWQKNLPPKTSPR